MSVWLSGCLTSREHIFVSYKCILAREQDTFDEVMIISKNILELDFYIVLAHWNHSPNTIYTDTLSWLRIKKSLFLRLNAVCLATNLIVFGLARGDAICQCLIRISTQ